MLFGINVVAPDDVTVILSSISTSLTIHFCIDFSKKAFMLNIFHLPFVSNSAAWKSKHV